ncbi:(2Fe-2S)-binding protein [Phaeovulum sp.]|uniref:(2Fe-2S)-binding protein n=1 Tax=Phaeovulum sp. TaxID=2934796 RepID=UPI003565C094
MSGGNILWNGASVPFLAGETVASALMRAGVLCFGHAPQGQARALFCGIGQCQNCLVQYNDRLTEACLLPCQDGMALAACEVQK